MGPGTPELSVVLPLADDHGYLEAALASWESQLCARERWQLVVVEDGAAPAVVARIRRRLRPGDVSVRAGCRNEAVLYQRGAEAAAAPLLLFTEAHCLAAPGAVGEVLDAFAEAAVAAVACRSDHVMTTSIGHLQGLVERRWFASWPPGHWRTLSLRGLAVRRRLFFELGGFPSRWERFAETALAAALHRRGHRLAATAAVAVHHVNSPTARDLFGALRGCGRGQGAWRQELEATDPGLADALLGPMSEWSGRGLLAAGAAADLAWAAIDSLRRDRGRPGAGPKARGLLAELPLLATVAAFGSRAARARTWLHAARAALLCSLPGAIERRLPSFERLWRAAFMCGLAEHLARAGVPSLGLAAGGGNLDIGGAPDAALAGFHAPQAWGAERMRWTGAAARLELALVPADWRLTFRVRTSRAPEALCLGVYVNRQRLAPEVVQWTPEGFTAAAPRCCWNPGPRQRLLLTVRAEPVGADPRRLGLAVFGCRIEPMT